MKLFLVLTSVFAAAAAGNIGSGGAGGYSGGQGNSGGYQQGGNRFGGSSAGSFSGGYSGGGSNSGFGSSFGSNSGFGSSSSGAGFGAFQGGAGGIAAGGQAEDNSPKTYRYVSVHVAPEEPASEAAKVIRVPGGANKHVNIIFVKAPSANGNQQTEVVLPEQDEHKNLVYVLLKKDEAGSNIKVRKPEAKKPTKPEVYFIKYTGSNGAEAARQGGQGGGFRGASAGGFGGSSGAGGRGGYSSAGPAYGVPA